MKIELNPQARIRELELENSQQYKMLMAQVETINRLRSALVAIADPNSNHPAFTSAPLSHDHARIYEDIALEALGGEL